MGNTALEKALGDSEVGVARDQGARVDQSEVGRLRTRDQIQRGVDGPVGCQGTQRDDGRVGERGEDLGLVLRTSK